MNRWEVFGAIFFGSIFALFAVFRFEILDARAAKGIAAVFLFGIYCGIVAFGTAGKKRSLSLPGQTVLGIGVALTIAALFSPPTEGFALAALLGLILGFTADRWVEHVQLP
ncbi:hypothetical protein LL972_20280 [Xanthomonas campestris pv. asclepiadis]|uniref:hypothetical protein n=1 Tax=Xanthomonas campestris TaxID=339 RepID=UPI001E34C6E9|nr:hypothetical protein [Xanthomonas campestris]MCC4618300.1 hypothetical protein [Xanthomonas campestris pv. asclepiadis]